MRSSEPGVSTLIKPDAPLKSRDVRTLERILSASGNLLDPINTDTLLPRMNRGPITSEAARRPTP